MTQTSHGSHPDGGPSPENGLAAPAGRDQARGTVLRGHRRMVSAATASSTVTLPRRDPPTQARALGAGARPPQTCCPSWAHSGWPQPRRRPPWLCAC